jgi:hypothetical protein
MLTSQETSQFNGEPPVLSMLQSGYVKPAQFTQRTCTCILLRQG